MKIVEEKRDESYFSFYQGYILLLNFIYYFIFIILFFHRIS